jgi:hypothetical protein
MFEKVIRWFNWDSIVNWCAAAGGVVLGLAGGWDDLMKVLVVCMAVDYATGLLNAIKDKTLSSKIGFIGLLRKITISASSSSPRRSTPLLAWTRCVGRPPLLSTPQMNASASWRCSVCGTAGAAEAGGSLGPVEGEREKDNLNRSIFVQLTVHV